MRLERYDSLFFIEAPPDGHSQRGSTPETISFIVGLDPKRGYKKSGVFVQRTKTPDGQKLKYLAADLRFWHNIYIITIFC